MSIAIVISNTLLLRGFKDEEAYIYQRLDLDDVAVMELLAPWRVLGDKRLGIWRLGSWAADGQ